MKRVWTVLFAFVAVGGLAAVTVTSRGAFVMGFFFVFWGAAAAVIAWLAGGKWTSEEDADPDLQNVSNAENRPFFDESGVHRFQGDVFDVENHPTPGAQGRV